MNKRRIFLTVGAVLCAVLMLHAQRKQCIDSEWKFLYGDGRAAVDNPSVANAWRTLTLPHDWSVETEAAQAAGGRVVGPFSTNSVGGFQTGFTVGGEGWYQKTIHVAADELKGRVELYFEGAYNHSWVYVNGRLCHENVYGYMSFRIDVTEKLHEGENSVVVCVQNMGNNSRWYAGSGIYRHVWLLRTHKLHLDEWDTFIQTAENRRVTVTATVHNESDKAAGGKVDVTILDAEGKAVQWGETSFAAMASSGSQDVTLTLTVDGAQAWSPESPYLYSAVIRVRDKDGQVVDELCKRVGFRTLSFSATEGFLLNGQPTLLRGGCVHHDNGMLGAAAFDKAETRKLRLIKNQGFNAVRCSHNLPSEHFLDVCDELGLMVIDECFDQWLVAKNADDYHQYFATHSDEDIRTMVRRDRNHPSIIMWSIGNEIPGRIEPAGMAAASRLRADILALDTTRPLTAAICGWDQGDAWNSAGGNWDAQCDKAFQSLDVGGYNYLYDKYERDHAAAPDRVMCGLESYPKQASENWTLVERHPYVIGDFVWTAIDYIGEAGIGAAFADHNPTMFQPWPWFNGHCGDLDLTGQKKPQSYYRDVVWRQAPVTMAVQPTTSYNNAWGWQLEEQSWTFPGREGQTVTINAYSRAPRVRLYLNDVVKGEATPGNTFWCGFYIPYEPGTLRLVNLDSSGNEVAGEEFVLKTTGQATAVRMVYDEGVEQISADENDLVFVTLELLDEDGNVVTSDCETQLSVSNVGVGELIGCCTGNPDDMQSFRSLTPTVFRGRTLAIVRSNGVAGPVRLNVEILEKEKDTSALFFKNARFQDENLNGWTLSSSRYIAYRSDVWHDTELDGFLECFVGWGTAQTLAGQSISQSTKVLPEGEYKLTFDYNGSFNSGGSHYQTAGTMSGVIASVGGQQVELSRIGADDAQHCTVQFILDEPQAVTFLIQFAADTNADWFALDNVNLSFLGSYDFEKSYIDRTSSVPAFGGANWTKVPGNASGSYTETKLSSAVYNGAGLAYWSAVAPQNTTFFSQDISHLPKGRYGLAAFCAANRWSGSDSDRNPQRGTDFFATTSGGTTVCVPVTTATYDLYSLTFNLGEDETLTLGMRATDANGNNWCYLSGITLVQLDSDVITGVKAVESGDVSDTYLSSEHPYMYDLLGRRMDEKSALPAGIYLKNGRKMLLGK